MKIYPFARLAGAALSVALLCVACTSVPTDGRSVGGSPEAWTEVQRGAPIRVAVYVDSGARSQGMFRWVQLMALSPDVKMFPIDGAGVRAGKLREADVLVMPGGRATYEARAMDKKGIDRLKEFIRNGGSYVGTCAGCFMVMQKARGEMPCEIVPYTFWRKNGKIDGERSTYLYSGDKNIIFNEKAKVACGLDGTYKLRYVGGPVMMRTDVPAEGANIETFATFSPKTPVPPEGTNCVVKIGDCAACVAGTYGKGRLFVLSVHPEADPNDAPVIQGAFRYVTGRAIRLVEPKARAGRPTVGFYCGGALGVDFANYAVQTLRADKVNVGIINHDALLDKTIDSVDVLLVADGPDFTHVTVDAFKTKKRLAALARLRARGGKIVTWGRASGIKAFANDVHVKDLDAAKQFVEQYAK